MSISIETVVGDIDDKGRWREDTAIPVPDRAAIEARDGGARS